MLSLHLFVFTKVAALNSTNDADVPLRTYSTNQRPRFTTSVSSSTLKSLANQLVIGYIVHQSHLTLLSETWHTGPQTPADPEQI